MFKMIGLGMSVLMLCAITNLSWADDQASNEMLGAFDSNCDENGNGSDCDKGEYKQFYRLDCRFHNEEHIRGIKFCYASAFYQRGEGRLKNIHLGVGCDNETLFSDLGRLHKETTLDRLSPERAATPAVEVFPQGQLLTEGTYTSVLDIPYGRLLGLCYVHKIH